MHILEVLTGSLSYDGISIVAMNILKHMSDYGVTVDFVVQANSEEKLIQQVKKFGSDVVVMKNRMKNPCKYVKDLKKVLNSKNYDIMHVHGNSATMSLELMAAKNCSTVKIIHSHNTTCKFKMIDKMLRGYMYKNTDHFLACGNEAGKWLCGGYDFDVIKNGIDLNQFLFCKESRKKIREQLKCEEEDIVIGHVGVFNEQKNQLFLIDVFDRLIKKGNGNYKLLLVGQGELLESAKKKVEDLQIQDKVIFYGTTDKMYELLSGMDLFAMPSLYEGLPLSLVEAQASGLPIIASDKITKEINITGRIKFCGIETTDAWVSAIEEISMEDRAALMGKVRMALTDAGYDLASEMQKLYSVYQKYASI